MELCFLTLVPEIVMTDFRHDFVVAADDFMQIEDISKDVSKVILFSSTSSIYPKNKTLLFDFMELDKPIN